MPDVDPRDRDGQARLSSLLDALHQAIQSNSESASDLVASALEAVSAARALPSGSADGALAEALFLLAIVRRRGNDIVGARDAYAEGADVAARVDAPELQLRAAAARYTVAELADIDAEIQMHLERASERAEHVVAQWGTLAPAVELHARAAARLAIMALGAGDLEGAQARLTATAQLSGASVSPPADLVAVAGSVSSILHSLHASADAERLLLQLVRTDLGDPMIAARALGTLGDLYASDDLLPRADAAYVDAVDVLAPVASSKDVDLLRADLLHGTGLAADGLGEYARAASDYAQVLELRTRWLPAGDFLVLLSRYNVAELARVSGDSTFAANELTTVAEALREHAEPQAVELRGRALKNLAQALLTANRPDEAERSALDGLPLTPETVPRAQLLFVLGIARRARGVAPGVEAEFEKLADEIRIAQGEDSERYAWAQTSLASLVDLDRAHELYEAVATRMRGTETASGRTLLGSTLVSLAAVRWLLGNHAGAFDALRDAVPITESELAESWRVGSALGDPPEQRSPLRDALITLVVRHLGERDDARRLAFRVALGTKRIQAEVVALQRDLVLQGNTDLLDVHDVAAALRRASVWSPTAGATPAPAPVVDLTRLETVLAGRVPRAAIEHVFARSAPDAVAASLPSGSVLVEYVRTHGIEIADRPDFVPAPSSYVAFVLRAGRPDDLRLVDLGPTARIDAAVTKLRMAIPGATRSGEAVPSAFPDDESAWRTAASEVAALVWRPVAGFLGHDAVVIAPDGALCTMPFDALIGDDGEPLLVTRALSFVATGRDLDRLAYRPNWATRESVVIAAPDYGGRGFPFQPLAGAAAEGRDIAVLLEVDPITGRDATRDAVLAVDDPEVLHFATHGYYFANPVASPTGPAWLVPMATHPLVASGVALAGVNEFAADGDPGVVTALDVIGLHLYGTDLVVLSACETGLGALDLDEGLLGLARSFVLAGARSVVWTLWKVDDNVAASLMRDFYRRVLDETPRALALHQAKQAVYAWAPDRPELWGAFGMQGDTGPLLRHTFMMVPPDQIVRQTAVSVGTDHAVDLDTEGRPVALFDVDIGDDTVSIGSMNVRNLGLGMAEDENARAEAAFKEQRIDDAHAHWTRALEFLGEHPKVGRHLLARVHDGLAISAGMLGRPAESREHGLAALKLFEAEGDAEHQIGPVLDNLASAESQLGDNAAALVWAQRSLEIKRTLYPPGDPSLTYTEGIVAQLDVTQGSTGADDTDAGHPTEGLAISRRRADV